MEFSLTEDQKMIFETIKELGEKKLNNGIFEDDENAVFPAAKWAECGRMGLFGMPVSEEYGGQGRDMLTTAHAFKALGYTCQDEGLLLSICAHMCTFIIPIYLFGTQEQKARFLEAACAGSIIGGNGISEAGAGSDVAAIRTSVTRQAGDFVINGSKLFVTNGPLADALVIYARHPGGMKMADISGFIVEKSGFTMGQQFKKMGLRTSPLCEIVLKDCRLSENNLLGRERLGLQMFNESMLWERIITSAYNIGTMERQYEIVLEHLGQREQFGQKLIKHPSMADKMVDVKTRIELSNLLLYKVCWKHDQGMIEMPDASMLKLFVSEAKVKSCLEAVHMFGAYGYLKESAVEKQLRDAVAATIYSGTSEMQKKIIAEKLGKIYE